MNVKVTGIDQVNEKDVINGFVSIAEQGLSNKDDIMERIQYVENKLNVANDDVSEYECDFQLMESDYYLLDDSKQEAIIQKYGTIDNMKDSYYRAVNERSFWNNMYARLSKLLDLYKNFNKQVCFSNIRELLKRNDDVKIGQIEKEARVRLGYMSRLEKDGNTSDPSIEFVVSSAKLLKVSVDTLISIDLLGLTPTEDYLVRFFDKLKADTLADKLEWNVETPADLLNYELDSFGNCSHPLLSYETFYEDVEPDIPEKVSRITFNSKSFGLPTAIKDDCFNLRLKNGATLYLMDISKSCYLVSDSSALAKEIWMFVPHKGSQPLVTTKDKSPIVPLVESLFQTVKERMQHPKVNKEIMSAIDAFMVDDFVDDTYDMPY